MPRLTENVESRAMSANQLQFTNESAELIADGFPNQRVRVPQNPAGLGITAIAEIAHQASAKRFGFADVNQLAVLAEHAVNARQSWR
jgi:hypothetical protein